MLEAGGRDDRRLGEIAYREWFFPERAEEDQYSSP